MPSVAPPTRQRLLAAARDEFAQFGLAGARVDRIATAARANKSQIYVMFGSKSDLFHHVVSKSLEDLSEAVAFTADDLPGYAGRLFDHLLSNPDVLRLTGWAQLELPDASQREIETYRSKIEAIVHAQNAGFVTPAAAPEDLLALLLGLTTAWATASPALRSLADKSAWDENRLQAHRATLIAAAQAVTSLRTLA